MCPPMPLSPRVLGKVCLVFVGIVFSWFTVTLFVTVSGRGSPRILAHAGSAVPPLAALALVLRRGGRGWFGGSYVYVATFDAL